MNKRFDEASSLFLGKINDALPTQGDQEVAAEMKRFSKMVKKSLGNLSGRVRSVEKKEKELQIDRAAKVARELLPEGTLQERSLNVFQYMNLYGGCSFISTLSETLKQSAEGHNLWKI